MIVMGVLLARQAGCHILFDYGPGIDLQQVLMPVHPRDDALYYKWTVPEGYECQLQNRCDRIELKYQKDKLVAKGSIKSLMDTIGQEKPLVGVPLYRMGFNTPIVNTDRLEREALPGFDLDTGMACALCNVMQLSPRAAEVEPTLFTKILPTLRDPENLVIAIYIRTLNSEHDTYDSKDRLKREEKFRNQIKAKSHIHCALDLERQYLSNDSQPAGLPSPVSISKVVWLIVSDSPMLKQAAIEEYTVNATNANVPVDQRKYKNREIPREVVIACSRGKHTKKKLNPSTADIAEAILDWYLIGESDVVITPGTFSFGANASLRTARPVYKNVRGSCPRAFLKKSV